MSDFKASSQNFDSGYIYKVEEREENEKIIRQSARGLLSIETNDYPHVIRYFIKNEAGEPQGYIERQLIPHLKTENSGGDNEMKQTKSKYEDMKFSNPGPDNQKTRLHSHISLKSGKKVSNCSNNPKRFYRSREQCHLPKYMGITECASLEESLDDKSFKNYTLDYTYSNSTPSEKVYAINHTTSTSNTFTPAGQKMEHKLTKEKVFSKTFTKKSPRIPCKNAGPRMFSKDPNKCLKNLFTIVKPYDNVYLPNCDDIDLLSKAKELLVKLIDKELQKIQSSHETSENVPQKLDTVMDNSVLKKLKLECMRRIEDELRLLKRIANY